MHDQNTDSNQKLKKVDTSKVGGGESNDSPSDKAVTHVKRLKAIKSQSSIDKHEYRVHNSKMEIKK